MYRWNAKNRFQLIYYHFVLYSLCIFLQQYSNVLVVTWCFQNSHQSTINKINLWIRNPPNVKKSRTRCSCSNFLYGPVIFAMFVSASRKYKQPGYLSTSEKELTKRKTSTICFSVHTFLTIIPQIHLLVCNPVILRVRRLHSYQIK